MAYDIGYGENPPIEQGSTYELIFTVTNIFEPTDTQTDLKIRAEYRPAVITASTYTPFDGTIISVTPTLVTAKVRLEATDTAAMTPGKGYWDCEIEDTNGFVLKPLGCGNKAKVVAEATRAVAGP